MLAASPPVDILSVSTIWWRSETLYCYNLPNFGFFLSWICLEFVFSVDLSCALTVLDFSISARISTQPSQPMQPVLPCNFSFSHKTCCTFSFRIFLAKEEEGDPGDYFLGCEVTGKPYMNMSDDSEWEGRRCTSVLILDLNFREIF